MARPRNDLSAAIEFVQGQERLVTRRQLKDAGIGRAELEALLQEQYLETFGRGIYKPSHLPLVSFPSLPEIGLRFPSAIICLETAALYHSLTTQNSNGPLNVAIDAKHAVRIGQYVNRTSVPKVIKWFRWEKPWRLEEGIETHNILGVDVRITSPERTVIDVINYRNKLTRDIMFEVLDTYMANEGTLHKLSQMAKRCGKQEMLEPYIDSMIHKRAY